MPRDQTHIMLIANSVEKKAVKDYKGSYGSAIVKGKVQFVKEEGVLVKDYSFTKSE
jgi:hypothetical protein